MNQLETVRNMTDDAIQSAQFQLKRQKEKATEIANVILQQGEGIDAFRLQALAKELQTCAVETARLEGMLNVWASVKAQASQS